VQIKISGKGKVTIGYQIGISVNSLAKNLRAITRIAKTAILQDLCPKSMGVSVKINFSPSE
jgi:hypothetical protein